MEAFRGRLSEMPWNIKEIIVKIILQLINESPFCLLMRACSPETREKNADLSGGGRYAKPKNGQM